MKEDLFKGLNPQQKKAATFTSGSSVILAGAGSGKTRVLVYKVLYLIEEERIDPGNILMITFTNKAAGEMKRRIKKFNKYDLGFIGTFHSFCAFVLRKSGKSAGVPKDYVIYDDDDQAELIRHILKEKDIKKFTPSFVQNRISAAKNQLITPVSYLEHFSDYSAPQMYDIYLEYEKRLQKNHALDFDDLILKAVTLFRKDRATLTEYQERFLHIFVDEFQDTNFAQYTLTRLLGKKDNHVTVVGDFSQSIYSWRGADIRNLEKFQVDFPGCKIFHLEQNYRSTQKILDFAHQVIADNEGHPILKLFTNNTEGEDVMIYEARNEEDEAFYVSSEIERIKEQYSFESMAVLYRTNAQSRAIEESFLHYGIPYMLIGGTRFYERKEIKDVLSYVRLIYNPQDEMAKDRIIKLGKRRWDLFRDGFQEMRKDVEKKSTSEIIEKVFNITGYLNLYRTDDEDDYSRLENIKELKSVADHFPSVDEFLQQVALVESEYSQEEKKRRKNEGVRLMTLHQAKGLEFKAVFITGLEDGILPHVRAIDDYFQLEEERRLFYVGITRAEKRLFITYAKRRFLYGRRGDSMKSRFLGGAKDEWY